MSLESDQNPADVEISFEESCNKYIDDSIFYLKETVDQANIFDMFTKNIKSKGFVYIALFIKELNIKEDLRIKHGDDDYYSYGLVKFEWLHRFVSLDPDKFKYIIRTKNKELCDKIYNFTNNFNTTHDWVSLVPCFNLINLNLETGNIPVSFKLLNFGNNTKAKEIYDKSVNFDIISKIPTDLYFLLKKVGNGDVDYYKDEKIVLYFRWNKNPLIRFRIEFDGKSLFLIYKNVHKYEIVNNQLVDIYGNNFSIAEIVKKHSFFNKIKAFFKMQKTLLLLGD